MKTSMLTTALIAILFAGCTSTPGSPQPPQAAPMPAQSSGPADLFDGKALRVVLCGTASRLPDPNRAKSCTAVIAGQDAWIIDTGPESWESLALMQFPGARIKGILLTHFHSDHFGDLGEFRLQTLVAGRQFQLPVYGPPGVQQIVDGINLAYSQDDQYRFAHHGPEIIDLKSAPLTARVFGASFGQAASSEEVILDKDGLRITAFQVNHEPVHPAVGYRFEFGGRSVVISGDTAYSSNLVENAKGADILISESLARNIVGVVRQQAEAAGNARIAKVFADVQTYHATPVEAAEMANQAGVGLLVYSHFMPPTAGTNPLYFAGVSEIRPEAKWVGGYDGLRIDLPLGSRDIVQSSVPMRR